MDHKTLFVHRVIWKMIYGSDPKADVDHINGVKHDNRIVNLREASRSQNLYNQKLFRNNTSGAKGVHWSNTQNKWVARIFSHKKVVYQKLFRDKDSAIAALHNARLILHGNIPIMVKYYSLGGGHL